MKRDLDILQDEDLGQSLNGTKNACVVERSPIILELGHLLKAVRRNTFISESILHGEDHWKRVTKNGLWIADRVQGADRGIIFLFGLLHDCRRQDDGADLSH